MVCHSGCLLGESGKARAQSVVGASKSSSILCVSFEWDNNDSQSTVTAASHLCTAVPLRALVDAHGIPFVATHAANRGSADGILRDRRRKQPLVSQLTAKLTHSLTVSSNSRITQRLSTAVL